MEISDYIFFGGALKIPPMDFEMYLVARINYPAVDIQANAGVIEHYANAWSISVKEVPHVVIEV